MFFLGLLADYLFIFLVFAVIYGLPAFSIIYFLVNLTKYLRLKKQCRREPDSVPPSALVVRKTKLIVASVVAAVLLAVVIGIVILFASALAYM